MWAAGHAAEGAWSVQGCSGCAAVWLLLSLTGAGRATVGCPSGALGRHGLHGAASLLLADAAAAAWCSAQSLEVLCRRTWGSPGAYLRSSVLR